MPHAPKVLVCGSRNWYDTDAISSRLSQLHKSTIIIHGAARGADTIARAYAIRFGLRQVAVPAKWEEHGRSAGPIRNRFMLDMKPDLVIAFHLGDSPGTWDCINEARRRGIPVEVIHALPR